MVKNKIALVFILIVVFLGFLFLKTEKKVEVDPKAAPQKNQPVHKVKFYDDKTFFEGIERAKDLTSPAYQIRGGIIPHDLFPGFIIANFFKRLSFQKPKTIVLIGPNHYERGKFKALTSFSDWETPFGAVKTNKDLINTLIDREILIVDESVLPEDHAVSGSIPFIKYYLPDTKVVPILLKGGYSKEESEILAENLKEVINEDVIVVAPVDFSHYLTSKEAKEKDKVTLKIMQDFDYGDLYLLNNDYLDSPPSIGVLLMLMQKLGTTKSEILFHTNSGELQKNNGIETTSYFSIAYYD